MLAQDNKYLQEVVSGVQQLTEEEKIRQQCEAREINAFWEQVRETDRKQELQKRENIINKQDHTINEQANTINEQANTISEQANTISEQAKQLAYYQKLIAEHGISVEEN